MPELTSSVDLLPTLLEATGVSTPPDVLGHSFWGLLSGGAYEPNTHIFAEMNTVIGDAKRCVRTARHKYIRNYDAGPALCMGTCTEISLTRRDMGDAHLAPRPPVELYDLADDPLERDNLAGQPEIAQIEAHLASVLDEFLVETGDPILSGAIPRPAGEAGIYRRIWSELPGDSQHPMRDIDAYLERATEMRRR
jgi:arylsulfatase A-like enzyme